VAAIRARTGAGVIKALSVQRAADLDAAAPTRRRRPPDVRRQARGELPGGRGASFDWGVLKGRRFAKPWFLAGGLTPANVGRACASPARRASTFPLAWRAPRA
jgi:phosphoribosylanthranilate isomerase